MGAAIQKVGKLWGVAAVWICRRWKEMAKYVIIQPDFFWHLASEDDPDFSECGHRVIAYGETEQPAALAQNLCCRCRRLSGVSLDMQAPGENAQLRAGGPQNTF
jgi:hypothetical protein